MTTARWVKGEKMRLIDADKLRTIRSIQSGDFNSIETIQKWIGDAPTVDAVPVRHGKWVHDGYDIPHGVDWMHCSECGNREPYVPAAMTNYCPNCGAKMDGEEK